MSVCLAHRMLSQMQAAAAAAPPAAAASGGGAASMQVEEEGGITEAIKSEMVAKFDECVGAASLLFIYNRNTVS